MRLAPQETERFYRIWFALLHYVNTQLHLVPTFPAAPGEHDVSPEVTMQVRDALWANDALREQFIADNPAQLSAPDLALVASWQYRLTGSFYILRSLQNYTIFLSDTTPAHAYGVLGLVSTIEETVPLPFRSSHKQGCCLSSITSCMIACSPLTTWSLGQDTAMICKSSTATFKSAKASLPVYCRKIRRHARPINALTYSPAIAKCSRPFVAS